jgi:hypothetical protein
MPLIAIADIKQLRPTPLHSTVTTKPCGLQIYKPTSEEPEMKKAKKWALRRIKALCSLQKKEQTQSMMEEEHPTTSVVTDVGPMSDSYMGVTSAPAQVAEETRVTKSTITAWPTAGPDHASDGAEVVLTTSPPPVAGPSMAPAQEPATKQNDPEARNMLLHWARLCDNLSADIREYVDKAFGTVYGMMDHAHIKSSDEEDPIRS